MELETCQAFVEGNVSCARDGHTPKIDSFVRLPKTVFLVLMLP